MKDSLQLAFIFGSLLVLVFFSIPEKSPYSEISYQVKKEQLSAPLILSKIQKEINTSLAPSEFTVSLIKQNYKTISIGSDFNSDKNADLIYYKDVLALQGSSAKKLLPNELNVRGFYILASQKSEGSSALLKLSSDGMFSMGKEILPVATPVYAYRILTEEYPQNKEHIIFKVELLNSDLTIVSEQVVIYWDKSAQTFVATNEFNPKKSFKD